MQQSGWIAILIVMCGTATTQAELKPLQCVPDELVLAADFTAAGPADKADWAPRQGTRWVIEDGVLRGRESSAEYQASRKDHFGYEPRISVPKTPAEFVAEFSVRFIDGEETAIVPFVEFGHHVCRVKFSQQGVVVLAEKETLQVASASDFVWQAGQWYHMLAEMRDGQLVLQIENGPTLFAEHESFREKPASGANGVGVAGPQHGVVEIDNVRIWSVQPTAQPGWKLRREQFPTSEPIELKPAKAKPAKKPAA